MMVMSTINKTRFNITFTHAQHIFFRRLHLLYDKEPLRIHDRRVTQEANCERGFRGQADGLVDRQGGDLAGGMAKPTKQVSDI
jgi:hypothetical protein